MDRYEQMRLLGGVKGESSVNQKLNNLRTREIRRARNVARRGQIPEVARFTFNDPSLPASVIAPASSSSTSLLPTPRAAPRARVRTRAFGLVAPPSWENHLNNTPNAAERRAQLEQTEGRELGSLDWDNVRDMTLKSRWETLAVGWSAESCPLPPCPGVTPEQGSQVPSLFDVAVQILFADPEWFCASVAFLPPHILGRISRYACVYQPQVFYKHLVVDAYPEDPEEPDPGQNHRTMTFFELVSGTEGELNYIGDGRSGKSVRRYLEAYDEAVKAMEAADSWDSPPELPPGLPNAIQPSLNPLLHLHLADFPVSTFLGVLPLLPPTLVRLSIVSLSQPKDRIVDNLQVDIAKCLRKLSKQLPLLELLDVSYNSWFRLAEQVQTVEWSTTWLALQTFIVRGVLPVEETQQTRASPDGSGFGVVFVEEADADGIGPPAVGKASMEINCKRGLGLYVRLGY